MVRDVDHFHAVTPKTACSVPIHYFMIKNVEDTNDLHEPPFIGTNLTSDVGQSSWSSSSDELLCLSSSIIDNILHGLS